MKPKLVPNKTPSMTMGRLNLAGLKAKGHWVVLRKVVLEEGKTPSGLVLPGADQAAAMKGGKADNVVLWRVESVGCEVPEQLEIHEGDYVFNVPSVQISDPVTGAVYTCCLDKMVMAGLPAQTARVTVSGEERKVS